MSTSELFVIGHRNPDTDAICSAIGYAEFKRRTGSPHAEAARCGDTNDRIDFVLQTFGMPAPRFLTDVSPKVRDVMADDLVIVPLEATLLEALSLMDERGIRVLPVVGEEGDCQGLVSVFKMNKVFCPDPGRLQESRRVLASLNNLARTLKAQVLTGRDLETEEELIVMVTVTNADTFANRLRKYLPESLAIIVGDRRDVQELALRAKVRVIIVTGDGAIDPAVVEEARGLGVTVLLSPHDTATTTMLCRAAVTVRHMVHEHFLAFRNDEALHEIQPVAANSNFHVFPVNDHTGRMVGILAKSDFLKKVERRLILVDHNELSQAVEGADRVEITEIIDHHRLGALTTSQPILFRNEPVGSTSTIVADCFFRHQIDLPVSIAGLLLAGLVSDTLNLTSPTTTERDAQILKKLESIAGVNATEFTEKLFASGSILTSVPPAQAINMDCKEFVENARTFSVAQIEELGFDQFWKRKDDLLAALEKHRKGKDYFFSALFVTDVVQKVSMLLIAGDGTFLKSIDYPQREPGVYEMAGVVSRKKQLLPYFIGCLQKGGPPRSAPSRAEPVTMV